MAYIKKLLFLTIFFSIVQFSRAQCDLTEDITICNMETIDFDGDTTPDGIINLYDEYTAATGLTVQSGTWSTASDFAIALDGATGNVSLWELRNATTPSTLDNYTFELRNTNCGTTVALTIRLILGPYTGVALPASGSNGVNIEVCDLVEFDLFNALVSDATIPSPHLNGQWVYNGSSPNFIKIEGSFFSAKIPYQPGLPLVDKETFDVVYTIPGIGSCADQSTSVRVSVVRQVSAGEPSTIEICESEILAGTYDADIDLRDDAYLIDEDIEGAWLSDLTGQISDGSDSTINIRALYDNLIDGGNNLRFGCEEYGFTYEVKKRSGVCKDSMSTVRFKFFEQLRPFQQAQFPEVCPSVGTLNLFDLLEFTPGFVYQDNIHTNWEFISGPSDLGLLSKLPPAFAPTIDPTCLEDFRIFDSNESAPYYSALGTIDVSGAAPGEYRFRYIVCPEINGCEDTVCARMETEVVVRVLRQDYAGEDTTVGFCETVGTLDLRSILQTNGTAIATTGVWTDTSGNTISNSFTIPTLTAPATFDFTHTATSADGCVDTATLALTISPLAGAGNAPGEVTVCQNNRTITLFELLTGNPNTTGVWTGPNGYTSPDHLGVFEENNINLPVLGEGTYVYTVSGSAECAFDDQTMLNIRIVEPADIGNDRSETFCKLDGSVNLFSLLDNDTDRTGVFEDTDGTGALNGDGVVIFASLTNGIYNFKYSIINAAPCAVSELTVSIQIVEVPIPNVSDQEFCILDGKRLDDVVVDVPNYNWYATLESTSPITDNPLLFDEQVYYIATVDADNCESERLAVRIRILNTGERSSTGEFCTIEFQDGVSPNGDFQNDTFDLNIEGQFNIPIAFPDFELQIFNRYGTPVYKGNQNTAEFRGESNLSVRLGDDLPSGTYFYIFEPNFENNLPIQGSFYLSR